MKNIILFIIILLTLNSCKQKIAEGNPDRRPEQAASDSMDMTNNFYDNTETIELKTAGITVGGEVENPGVVDLNSLPLHSVIVKETLLDSAGGNKFIGAYRYDGYSLFDILNTSRIKKIETNKFNPVIDLYVEIENKEGEKAVFSWGEIYYPNNLHKIIIAGSVSRIVPSRSKDRWVLPSESRVVAGSDLITERNISGPVKVTVKSIARSYTEDRGIKHLYSPEFVLFMNDKKLGVFKDNGQEENVTYNTIFYGRGRGIHSTLPFKGLLMKDVIAGYFPVTKNNLQSGIFCMAGSDGYHCAVSYSELFNRNDQQEFLLVRTEPDEDGGLYRVFPASDFFSDRAIKSLSEIHLEN
jgi:hypothetical protein